MDAAKQAPAGHCHNAHTLPAPYNNTQHTHLEVPASSGFTGGEGTSCTTAAAALGATAAGAPTPPAAPAAAFPAAGALACPPGRGCVIAAFDRLLLSMSARARASITDWGVASMLSEDSCMGGGVL